MGAVPGPAARRVAAAGPRRCWHRARRNAGAAAAAIEIMPRGLVNHIYRDLSRVLGVYYEEVAATPVRGCGGGSTDARLACNVTVKVDAVTAAVARAVEWTGDGASGGKAVRKRAAATKLA
eukprot:5392230-Prymnesium_polylepis.2